MIFTKQGFIYILFQIHVYLYIVFEYVFTTNGVSSYIVIGTVIYTLHNIALYLFKNKRGVVYRLILKYIQYALFVYAILLATLIAFDIYFYTGGKVFGITR